MTEYLDISTSVTEEQYRRVLESLLEQFEDWRNDKGWCTDLYLYVARLTRTFHWNRHVTGFYDGYDGHMEISYPADRTGQEMATDLRQTRGRILRFSIDEPSYLSMERANDFLTRAGLEPHVPEQGKRRWSYEFSGVVETELTEAELRAKAQRQFARMGGQGRANVYITARTPYRQLQVSETTDLLPMPGSR